jgi:DNA-binding MarR family transcriptional regulator
VTQTQDTDGALSVLRAMVAIADSTLENVAELTLTQFRVLRVVVARTPVTMSAVARELAVNPSSVTRACDRLVALDLLQRAPNPLNRRETLLAPTAAGRRVVDRVDHNRREALSTILDRLDPAARSAVLSAFVQFTQAASMLVPEQT